MLSSSSSGTFSEGKSVASSVGGDSTTSVEHVRNNAIKEFQSRLVWLYHASNCQYSNATPPKPCRSSPGCYDYFLLLKHVNSCDVFDCIVPHCVSTRYLLGHYRSCETATCVICKPLNDSIQRKRNRTKNVVVVQKKKRSNDSMMEDLNDAVLDSSNHSVHSMHSDTDINLDASVHGSSAPSSPATATMIARHPHLLNIPRLKDLNKQPNLHDVSSLQTSVIYPETSFETETPREDSLFSPRDDTPYSAPKPPTASRLPASIPRFNFPPKTNSAGTYVPEVSFSNLHNQSLTTNDTSYETITPRDDFIFTPREETPMSAPYKSFNQLSLTASRSIPRPVVRPTIIALPIHSLACQHTEPSFDAETPRENESTFTPREETPLPTPRDITHEHEHAIGFDQVMNMLNEVNDPNFFARSPTPLSPQRFTKQRHTSSLFYPSLSSSSSSQYHPTVTAVSSGYMYVQSPPPAKVGFCCIKCSMTMLGGYRYYCQHCGINLCARCFHCVDDLPHEHPLRAYLIESSSTSTY